MRRASASLHLDSGRELRGGQRQVLDLLCGLRQRGHRVLLCCPGAAPLFAAGTAAGVPCQALTLRSGFDFPSAVRLARLVAGGDFDLVHAHDTASHGIARAAQGMSRHAALRENLFVTCRSVSADPGPLERPRSDALGSHYIASSRRIRDLLLRRGADPARVAVVPSGVDPERLSPARARALPDPWGLSARGLRVLGTVARLARDKNPALLVDAFARLRGRHPDTHLLLVGDGPLRRALEQRVEQQQLSPHVTFAGHLDDVGPAYAAMQVFVVASESESSCSALLDAMSAGVPVVATACEGVLDLVRHGESALVVPKRDAAVLAEAVGRILEQPDLAARLVEGGLHLARQHSMEAVVEATLEVYSHVGASGAGG